MQSRAESALGRALTGAGCSFEGLAWVDLRTGTLLEVSARSDAARDAIAVAALVALDACAPPELVGVTNTQGRSVEALVVSDAVVQAFAISGLFPDRAVVGVAPATTNVALALAFLRRIAEEAVE